jgi:hypothetical protein
MKRLDQGVNNLYPTPVYLTTISKEDCEDLLASVMQNELVINPNGDDSSLILKKIPRLREIAKEKFSEYLKIVYGLDFNNYKFNMKAWLAGSRGGYSMETHNHAGSPFIAVFYIMSECQDHGGEIVLTDPRTNANRGYTLEFQPQFSPTIHTPATGDVLIFPGFLYHHVRQYTSTLRIAIPVDLFLYTDD